MRHVFRCGSKKDDSVSYSSILGSYSDHELKQHCLNLLSTLSNSAWVAIDLSNKYYLLATSSDVGEVSMEMIYPQRPHDWGYLTLMQWICSE